MAFRFTLESVLRLRSSYERQEQARLESAARSLYAAQERCDFLAKERVSLEEKFCVSMAAGLESAELHYHLSAKAGLELAEAEAAQELIKAREHWNHQRIKFLQARQNREVISSIRDRQHKEYMATESRREQQQLDDLFNMRRNQQNR
jgi:flagellar export protein FliJ